MKFQIPHFPYLTPTAATVAAIFVAIALSIFALAPTWPAGVDNAVVVPLPVGVASFILVCCVALCVLEYGQRTIAILLAGIVALAVTTTIASWVLETAPPFNVFLFGAPQSGTVYFPTGSARDAVMPVTIASLVIALMAMDVARAAIRPLGWAAGLVLLLTPALRYLVPFALPFTSLSEFATHDNQKETVLIWIAISLLGAALMGSRHTSSIADGRRTTTDWGARGRATIVVGVVSVTLGLWHTLRATEIRQLQELTQAASRSMADEWQKGLTDRIRATDRLTQHWIHLGWNVPGAIFLSDSQAFMRDYSGIHAIILTDAQGRITKIARRAIPIGTTPSENDFAELASAANPGVPLTLSDGGLAVARSAIATKSRVRSATAVTVNNVDLVQTAGPALDANNQVAGALVMIFRRDINDAALLESIAPDYYLRVFTNNKETYRRRTHDGSEVTWPRPYATTLRLQLNSNDYQFELAPSPSIIALSLTWTPSLILVFAWASLILLTFALYNERRAFALARDRERILNESLDLICTLDANGCYVTVNETSLGVLGYTPKEMIGRHYADFILSDENNFVEQLRENFQASIKPIATPIRFQHKNGTVVYLQGNTHWSPDEQLFYCDMRDISEQHALELARQQAANTLSAGVEQAGCVVYEYHYDTQTISWVGAIHALTGYEPSEFAAAGFEGWMEAVHPDDRAHVRHTLQRCLESRQPHTIDYRLRRKDGAYAPVLDRGRHVDEAAHVPARMIGALIDLSAIRQQETALRRSEERYRIIATQVGAVIIERDIPTNRVRIFGPVEQIYGYAKEQIESRPYGPEDTMVHSEDRARVNAIVAAAEKSLSSYYVEYRRRHRGGHYIHIASRGVVLPGADGRAERAVIAVTDITERKLAESRLTESDERFRLAAEQAKQIVYEFALNERLEMTELRFVGATDQVLGYSTADLHELYKTDRQALFHPDDIAMMRAAAGSTMQTRSQFNIEHRLKHRDGHYVYVEDRGAVRRDAQGNIAGIVGMLLDITARRNADSERHAYTMQLGKLADVARKVSTLLSLHDLLSYLARSMRELFGVNAASVIMDDPRLLSEQIFAVSFTEHYGPQRIDIPPFGSQELHALLIEDTPIRLSASDTSGDPRWSQLTQNDAAAHALRGWLGVPLTTRDGERLGLLQLTDKQHGDFTDSDAQIISQLAGLASVAIENIRLYATLEERVTVRTRELQISNRELEAFSYSVSHDLRAPLRAIAGFSSILEQEYAPKLDTTARRYLQRIGSGVERMANLIDDLLSLARVSRLDLKRESIDLSGLCRTIVKRQLERWPDRDLQIRIDPRMRVNADPRLVEVALENLVENAIKFTSTRPQSEIHIGKHANNTKPAYFVRDNGVGFDPKYATNLFGVFQRLHSASEFPGTGVGLATVQRIMQRHRGRVWAESEIDQGATFYFNFDSEA